MESLHQLHQRILGCHRCEAAGFIVRAVPVAAPSQGRRLMLIGQAPGQVELELRRPFQGRAGRELFRWLASIGIEEEAFRREVYMTAITKCFPGKARSGSGDRRPSAREIALCRPYLQRQLELVQPETIFLVGGMAIERFLAKAPLAALIGQRFQRDGRTLIPLPHPSGASRWMNAPEHRRLLHHALTLIREEWDRVQGDEGLRSAG